MKLIIEPEPHYTLRVYIIYVNNPALGTCIVLHPLGA
jgi:hypothetical protein